MHCTPYRKIDEAVKLRPLSPPEPAETVEPVRQDVAHLTYPVLAEAEALDGNEVHGGRGDGGSQQKRQ